MYSILEVLQNFVGYGKANTEKKGLDFRFDMSEEMPWRLSGEPEVLKQNGINLLSDAIKYTNSGYIHLSAGWKQTEGLKGQLCISVRDTGIAEEAREEQKTDLTENGMAKQQVYGEGMKISYTTVQEAEQIDMEEACCDREALRRELQTVFFKEDKTEDLEAFYEVKDWINYRILAHELKCISKAIGASELSEIARRMELAAKEKNTYFIDNHHNELIKTCREVLQATSEKLFGKQIETSQKFVSEKAGHILVVDDDKKNIKAAKKILANQFELDCVNSGREALEFLEEKIPELILLDLHMPDLDGFEVMEQLQNNPATKEIPVIFLTADRNRGVEIKGFKAGAQDLIIKPFVAEVVVQRVSRVLELSRLQKNLQQEVEKQTKKAEERRRQVERLSNQIINALAETIDAKDTYTNGHSLRVAQYSVEIAKQAGKSKEEQEHIYYMGMLHDIGKIGIPDSIITKNSSLSDKEYFVTRKHPEIGAEILATISEIPDLGVGARWHHERYDGTGYPDGRKGTDIPEEARIIAVADAYDAMASRRSYRDVLPQKVVYEEIRKGRGTQFDPAFADIMLKLMEEDTEYNMREK